MTWTETVAACQLLVEERYGAPIRGRPGWTEEAKAQRTTRLLKEAETAR